MNEDDVLSFDEFAKFIRVKCGFRATKLICRESRLEGDLGVTGDDGIELLEAVEEFYGVFLQSGEDGYRRTFGLAENESLFHGEGGPSVLG